MGRLITNREKHEARKERKRLSPRPLPEASVRTVEVVREVIKEVPVEVVREVRVEVPVRELVYMPAEKQEPVTIVKEVRVEVPVEKKVYVDRPYEVQVVKESVVHNIEAVLEEKQKVHKLEKANKRLKIACAVLVLLAVALGVTHA